MEAITTKFHPSCKITWRRGTMTSQLDHVLRFVGARTRVTKLRGTSYEDYSDHKLLHFTLTFLPETPATEKQGCRPNTRRTWDVKLLQEEGKRHAFIAELNRRVVSYNHNELDNSANWIHYCDLLKATARTVLSGSKHKDTLEPTPVLKEALINHKQSKFRYWRVPTSENLRRLRDARAELKKRKRQHEVTKYHEYFQTIDDFHVGERIKKLYSFVKLSRQTQPSPSRITLRQWEQVLKSDSRPNLPLVPDPLPQIPPPSLESVVEVLLQMRRNRAPGEDGVPLELLLVDSRLSLEILHKIICSAWKQQDIPDAWTTSLLFALPKVPKPTTVDDYRLLTLASVGYKVFIILLYNEMQKYLPPIGYYQAGFEGQRSAVDHLFVLRRILEEDYNEGMTCYVIAIDVKRAFDSVDLTKIPGIFKDMGVPAQLINLLILTALTNRVSLQWFSQRTPPQPRTTGIRQGCPRSPNIFNRVTDRIIQRLVQELSTLGIRLEIFETTPRRIRLPCLLCYADDLMIMARTLEQVDVIMTLLQRIMGEYNLSINPAKTKIMVRGASVETASLPRSYNLGSSEIERVEAIKYLGSTVNSKPKRSLNLKNRKISALRVFHSIKMKLKMLRAPIQLLLLVYTTVLLPILTYGLNVLSLTKANRMSLARQEALIVQGMSEIAQPKVRHTTVSQLLNGRTINLRISAQRMRFHAHILRRPQDSALPRALRLTVKKRRVGRPTFTWPKTLADDRRLFPFTDAEFLQNVPDKTKIKLMSKAVYENVDPYDLPIFPPVSPDDNSREEMEDEDDPSPG